MTTIRIAKNTLHTNPGGCFDMKDGNEIEKRIAKLYVLQARISHMIGCLADSGEINPELGASAVITEVAEAIYVNEYKDFVENYSLWKLEFDHTKYTIPAFIAESPDWEDISWHNDVCPRFLNCELGLELFIAADKEIDRESDMEYRFSLHSVSITQDNYIGNWLSNVGECETEEELIALLDRLR